MIYRLVSGQNQIVAFALILVLLTISIVFAFNLDVIEPSYTPWFALDVFLYHFILSAIAIILNRFLIQMKLVPLTHMLTGFLVLLFFIAIPFKSQNIPIFISLLSLVYLNTKMVRLYNQPHPLTNVYELGVLMGVVVMFTPSFLPLILILIVGLTLVKSFSWRDFVVPQFGLFSVVGGYYLCRWFFNLPLQLDFIQTLYLPKIQASFSITQISITALTFVEFLFVVALFKQLESLGIKERVNHWVWIWTSILLILSLVFFVPEIDKILLVSLLGVPVSVFSFEYYKEKLPDWKKDLPILILMISVCLIRVFA